jgi:hypothetical protein
MTDPSRSGQPAERSPYERPQERPSDPRPVDDPRPADPGPTAVVLGENQATATVPAPPQPASGDHDPVTRFDHPVGPSGAQVPGDPDSTVVLPGVQIPVAVIPGMEPSGPLPIAAPPSQPFPAMAPPQPYVPVPPKPRNKAATLMVVLMVFFVLTTATLGTLYLVEVGDHKATSSDLQTTRDTLDKTKAELKTTQADKETAVAAKQRLERDAENSKPCLTAVKGMIHARTEDEFTKFADDVDRIC